MSLGTTDGAARSKVSFLSKSLYALEAVMWWDVDPGWFPSLLVL